MNKTILNGMNAQTSKRVSSSLTFNDFCGEIQRRAPVLLEEHELTADIGESDVNKNNDATGGDRTTVPFHGHDAAVHEESVLGSDSEQIEVSPSTSDQVPGDLAPLSNGVYIPVPNVKPRHKPNTDRKWSEEDIQKRLSLPVHIRLPQEVVEKLNRTLTFHNPLTRKSRRTLLAEVGFGKRETYEKILVLGEGTCAKVFLGKSLLTGNHVALKEIQMNHNEVLRQLAIKEVGLLRNLKHANVVTLHDIIYFDNILTLVLEYVEYDLHSYMNVLHLDQS